MSSIVSVRLSENEKELLDQVSNLYGCGISSLMKRFTFEKIENDYDLMLIADYEKSKEDGTLKTKPIDDLFKELGI